MNHEVPLSLSEVANTDRRVPDSGEPRQQSDRERRRSERMHALKRFVDPILAELHAAGFDSRSIDELRTSGVRYDEAVPVLMKWLPIVPDAGLKESIVRALSVPWARSATNVLIMEFRKAASGSSLKWAIGNALEVLADDTVFEEIRELVLDKRNGLAREMLALSLGKMKNAAAVASVMELLKDDIVAAHALGALRKLKASEAKSAVASMLQHPNHRIRKEAEKTYRKLSRD